MTDDAARHISREGPRRPRRDEVDQLGAGELRVVGQGPSYEDTFKTLADQMRPVQLASVADMPLEVITTYASMPGLIEAPPDLGNHDAAGAHCTESAPIRSLGGLPWSRVQNHAGRVYIVRPTARPTRGSQRLQTLLAGVAREDSQQRIT